jgi:hypothetical protein
MTTSERDTMSDAELRRHAEIELEFIRSRMALHDYSQNLYPDEQLDKFGQRHQAMRQEVLGGCDLPYFSVYKYLDQLGLKRERNGWVLQRSNKVTGPLVGETPPTPPTPLRVV